MTGKYQAYPEYKDSGVKWLGEIPAEWVVSKIKYLAPFQVGWTPPTKNDANFDGTNLWANISDLKGRTLLDTAKKISDSAAKEASMDLTPKGSLLYSFKLSVGAVSFAGRDMYTNEAIASFLEGAELPLSYLYYVLPKFVIENASTNIYGARILNQELISNALILAPSYTEAQKIANFLDHETAKIDTLIEEQQSLIRLLKEKRQAVISHAVTKGLNPNAPMKDSGVEWLGEVPAHWGAPKVRYVAKLESGHTPSRNKPEYWANCYIPWISLSDVWQLREGNQKYISTTNETISDLGLANSAARLLPKGTVILSRTASVGFAGIMGVDMTTTQDFANWICSEKIIPEYLLFCFWAMKGEFSRLMMGSTHKTIYMPDIKELFIALPPLSEQKNIINHINEFIPRFDCLEEDAKQAIKLLEERRTALTSAAVTGKIDVRNWVAPTTEPENASCHSDTSAIPVSYQEQTVEDM